MRPQSLKSKLLLAVFSLVIASSVLVSLLVTHRYSKSLVDAATAQAENIAHAIALEATDKILINDHVALQKTLDHHLHSNSTVAYLFVLRQNQVLAHTFPKGVPADLISANSNAQENQASIQKIISTENERYLDIAWPIFSGKAGTLRLGLSEKPYRMQVTQLWLQMSLLTVGILAVALIISLFFIKKVTRPLSLLAETAEKIDEGNLNLTVAVPSQGEVGKLAQSLNNMLLRIKDYTRRLEDKNVQLDRAQNQTRTALLISQQINALSNLKEVCNYLVNKFQEIVTCKNLAMAVFLDGNNELSVHSGQASKSFSSDPASAIFTLLAELKGMTFIEKNQIKIDILPQTFHPFEKLVVFPLYEERQLLGAMLIACSGDCTCVTKELDVIEMILNQVAGAIRRAIAHEEEIRELRTRFEQSTGYCGIIGKDPQMQVIYKLIEDIAPTEATVLIQGESGTGKELVARAIHQQSLRKDRPFVVINCSAYPVTLLESELFGHEKGAFTGAIRQKSGRFEQADGGTVFLDEIGEIPPVAQIKLLRILQSQKFERVGGEKTLSINVRVLAATNKYLLEEVRNGNFREDLFYRLNVIPIQLPPLRKRRNDIPLLVRYFLERFAAEQNKSVDRISSEAMRRLLDYNWPGNVRELENSIEHALVLAKGKYVEVADLPAILQQPPPESSADSQGTILENERRLLKDVLEQCSWNKKEAAMRLGISRSTLYDKLKKYQITKPTLH
jgi:transcriptional regulator with GAF, ATPase, and Fis domain